MAAIMVVKFLLMVGPSHGFTGPHEGGLPKGEVTHMQADHAGKPQSIKTQEA